MLLATTTAALISFPHEDIHSPSPNNNPGSQRILTMIYDIFPNEILLEDSLTKP